MPNSYCVDTVWYYYSATTRGVWRATDAAHSCPSVFGLFLFLCPSPRHRSHVPFFVLDGDLCVVLGSGICGSSWDQIDGEVNVRIYIVGVTVIGTCLLNVDSNLRHAPEFYVLI